MDFFDHKEYALRSNLRVSLREMYEYAGINMGAYDFYAKRAHETLKELSMMISIDEFKVLKQQYYCAIYDGEWIDETESKEN